MFKSEKMSVVIRPDWIETAKVSLINRKSKKEYLRFLEIIGEMIVNGELSDEFIDDSKAYKLFKSLQIKEKIDTDLTKYRKKKSRYFNESNKEKTDNQESNFGIPNTHNQYHNHNSITNSNTTDISTLCDCNAIDMSDDFDEIDKMF
ncbi:MAG: hypothetical protein II453_13875 [Alphaproteobacteria bacterium]|nr:hypothetical protein [Alphaproteobacteria bacterium]